MSETEYFRQACKDQVKFTNKLCMERDHTIALLELKIKELNSIIDKYYLEPSSYEPNRK